MCAIPVEELSRLSTGNESAVVNKEVLVGEIDGMKSIFHSLPKGECVNFVADKSVGRIFIFTAGKGEFKQGAFENNISEIVLCCPRTDTDFIFSATDDYLECIELIIPLDDEDKKEIEERTALYPHWQDYSKCATYKESIKSEKTINRTLLSETVFPRMCIGSVETMGADKVAPHSHPMLEQLFFGLPKNYCVVRADADEHNFDENELIHIPLGSTHSVKVEDNELLHYIWIDMFPDREGLAWITANHHTEDE